MQLITSRMSYNILCFFVAINYCLSAPISLLPKLRGDVLLKTTVSGRDEALLNQSTFDAKDMVSSSYIFPGVSCDENYCLVAGSISYYCNCEMRVPEVPKSSNCSVVLAHALMQCPGNLGRYSCFKCCVGEYSDMCEM